MGLLLDGGFGGGSAGGLAGWLAGWPAGWLAGRRHGWLVGRQASKRQPLAHFKQKYLFYAGFVHILSSLRFAAPSRRSKHANGRRFLSFFSWLVGWPAGRMAGWLAGRPAGRRAGWRAGWRAGRVVGWQAEWQAGFKTSTVGAFSIKTCVLCRF